MPKRDDGNDTVVKIRTGGQQIDLVPQDAGTIIGTQIDLPSGAVPVYPEQEYDFLNADKVCCKGWDQLLLDDFFVLALKSHFVDPANIFHDALKAYTFKEGHDSKLNILLSTKWDPNTVNVKQAIVIKRGPLQAQRIGFRDFSGEDEDGTAHYVRRVAGQHKLIITAETDGQTELLAHEVFAFFTAFTPAIMAYLPFQNFDVVGMSPLMVKDPMGHEFGVTVGINYAYDFAWSIKQAAVPLRAVRVVADTALDQQ